MKKLYRSRTNKTWGGVIGGLGEYMEVDPVVLRLAFVFIVLITGFFPGVLAYIIFLMIVPEHPKQPEAPTEHTQQNPQS